MKNKNMQSIFRTFCLVFLLFVAMNILTIAYAQSSDKYLFHDSHFHITNFIQEVPFWVNMQSRGITHYQQIMDDRSLTVFFHRPYHPGWACHMI